MIQELKRVLSFIEAAEYCGFKPSYFYKLTSGGHVPCSKPLGKKLYFDRLKLDEWLLSNSTKGDHQNESEASTAMCK
jgi:excisionase family DNA binding protein